MVTPVQTAWFARSRELEQATFTSLVRERQGWKAECHHDRAGGRLFMSLMRPEVYAKAWAFATVNRLIEAGTLAVVEWGEDGEPQRVVHHCEEQRFPTWGRGHAV